ncbi:unnamed protein product [Linum trigynum]|uniref:GRF-type domain-containing protein n=1 Tax=Linum trigynum TaxID=586398 RepID=A0AAV2CX87_9ROSI
MKKGETKKGGDSSRANFMADLVEEEEVYCGCPFEAVMRISRTSRNPNRAFWACSQYRSKAEPGCGFFDWCDVRAVQFKEQRLRNVIARLQSKVCSLEKENDRLVQLLAVSRPTSAAACDQFMNVDNREIEVVKQRLTQVERQLSRVWIN